MTSSESSLAEDKKIVLCIDDEPSCLRFYRLMLEDAGYRVVSFSDARSGLQHFSPTCADLAVLDYSMPDLDGAEVARAIREISPHFPIIMLSALPECPPDAQEWVNVYLMKIRDFDELRGTLTGF
jgi:CheY-like chemotaxis protein